MNALSSYYIQYMLKLYQVQKQFLHYFHSNSFSYSYNKEPESLGCFQTLTSNSKNLNLEYFFFSKQSIRFIF